MKRLIENPVIDHPEVLGAYNYAKAKHDATGATRKSSGLPYFVHPEMVADVVEVYDGTIEEIEAALLHDTLEDTDATAEEIEELYGPEVAQIVEEVTNFKPEVDRLGKEQYINKELLELSDSALLVKLADMYCNSLDYPKPGQAERVARNLQYLLDFGDDLDPRCRRLIKSFPLMRDYELGNSEFETSIDDDDFEEDEYMRLTASRKRKGNKLEEEDVLLTDLDSDQASYVKDHEETVKSFIDRKTNKEWNSIYKTVEDLCECLSKKH